MSCEWGGGLEEGPANFSQVPKLFLQKKEIVNRNIRCFAS
jgi:hypothetical protein